MATKASTLSQNQKNQMTQAEKRAAGLFGQTPSAQAQGLGTSTVAPQPVVAPPATPIAPKPTTTLAPVQKTQAQLRAEGAFGQTPAAKAAGVTTTTIAPQPVVQPTTPAPQPVVSPPVVAKTTTTPVAQTTTVAAPSPQVSQAPIAGKTVTNARGEGVYVGGSEEMKSAINARVAQGMSVDQAYNQVKSNLTRNGVTDFSSLDMAKSLLQAPAKPATPQQVTGEFTSPTGQKIIVVDTDKDGVISQVEKREQGVFGKTPTQQGVDSTGKPLVNYDSSQGRESEISTNLNNITAQDSNLLKDRNAFNAAFGYETADAGKKAILDSFWNGKQAPIDPESLYNGLKSGVKLTPEQSKTQNGVKAQAKFDIYNKYATAGVDELFDALKNNSIPSSMIAELSTNPNYVAAKQKYDAYLQTKTINENNNAIGTVFSGRTTPVPSRTQELTDSLMSIISGKGIDRVSFKDYIANNTEITAKTTELNAKNEEQKNLIEARDVLLRDIKAQYKGLPLSLQISLAAKNAQPLNDQIRTNGYELDRMSADLKYMTELATTDYKYDQDLQKEQRGMAFSLLNTQLGQEFQREQTASAQDFAREQTAVQQAFTREQTAAQQAFAREQTAAQQAYAAEQFKIQQAYANPDINSSNPQIANIAANNAIARELAFARENGIPVIRSQGQILQDAQNYANENGVSLSQAIQETFTKPFQEKPEYQQAISSRQAGQVQIKEVTDSQGNRVSVKIDSQGNVTPVFPTGSAGDLRSYASQFPNEASLKNNNPAGITYNDTFAKTLTNAGVQFSKGTARPANEGGNYFSFPNIEEGFRAYDILWSSPSYQNLTVGAALQRWGTGSVPGVDVNKKVSDLTELEKRTLQMAQIKKESPGMFKILSQTTEVPGAKREYDDNDIALLSSVTKLDKQGKDTLNQNGYTEKEWANFNAGLLPPTTSQKETANSIITQVNSMLADEDALSDAVGTLKTPGFVSGTKRKDFEVKFNTLRDTLAFANIDKLKGAMSDKDIEFLRNTAAAINLDQSEEAFKKALEDIRNRQFKIVNRGASTQSTVNLGRWQP